jgi:hypothetical protein
MIVDRNNPPENSILTIRPYKLGSIWVFDDEVFGLKAEAFVGDINKMIDAMLERADLPKSEPFTAMFSDKPFPGYHMHLKWIREEYGGNWYRDISDWASEDANSRGHSVPTATTAKVEGWLCPVLCMFFKEAPKNIYVRAEP